MDIRPVIAYLEIALARANELSERVKDARGVELADTVRELREALLEAKRQCLALEAGMSALEELLAEQDQIKKDRGMYWRFVGDKQIGGPFCPRCYEAKQELAGMRYHPGAIGHHPQPPYYECERCGARCPP